MAGFRTQATAEQLRGNLSGFKKAVRRRDVEIERLRAELLDFRNAAADELRNQRNTVIEECARLIEQWENDPTPRSYLDLIDAIRALKDKT